MWNQSSLQDNINQEQSSIVSQLGARFGWGTGQTFNFEDIAQQDLDRCVLHFHSSRDPSARLEWMQKTWKQLNILEDKI